MNKGLDLKRLFIFLGFAFGLAWIVGLIVYLTGGITNSPEIIPGSRITLALVLIAIGYMWSPALANIFTRLITRQGRTDLLLRPNFKGNWKFWVAAWVAPALITILGGIVYFVIFPAQYDASLSMLQKMIGASPAAAAMNPWLIVALQLGSSILIAPLINSLFTFGEEFGWRGYLLPNLLPLGEKRAYLISGVIWGIWHAPIIAMGHNFGLDYPGAPWLGILVMIWFCIMAGTFLGWLSNRAGSVWPAVIGHAAINGIAGLSMLFVIGQPNLLLGPTPLGLIGSIGYLVVFAWIIFSKNQLEAVASPMEIIETS